jgi:DNA modification methylase
MYEKIKHEKLNIIISKEQWIEWNSSIWFIGLSMESIIPRNRGLHPCPSTPELYYRLMLIFSKPGALVLDPFSGSGTGGVVAKLVKRNFLGLELNKDFVNLSLKNLNHIKNIYNTYQTIINTDSRSFDYEENKIDLVITSPPYYNYISYSNLNRDISNFKNLEDYLNNLIEVFVKIKRTLKKG